MLGAVRGSSQRLGGRISRSRSTICSLGLIGISLMLCTGCGGGARHAHRAPSTRLPTAPGRAPTAPPPPPAHPQPPPAAPQPPGAYNGAPPPTVINSPGCKPPHQHPYPVILVPGTYALTSWQVIAPALAQLGYCVYTFNYGDSGTGDIVSSAQQLAGFVNRLLARTHASRVSIVGHSEGGMMPRYYIKFLGGAAKVATLVGLAPSNHGTLNPSTFGGALTGCTACAQQQAGSPFLANLNDGDETPPPVTYTVIASAYDQVLIPYTSAFLSGPVSRVTNVTLQQQCPREFVGHVSITLDPVALQWVENALAHGGPADPNFVPSC
jgi:triacylglycerol lipase